MSTGADCRIYEKTPGAWFYDLQEWPYGDTPDYGTYGPFPHFKAANKHLDEHHANPGGYSIEPLPGCPHDMRRRREAYLRDETPKEDCERCGDSVTSLNYAKWRSEFLKRFRKMTTTGYFKFAGTDRSDLAAIYAEGSTPEDRVLMELRRIKDAKRERAWNRDKAISSSTGQVGASSS